MSSAAALTWFARHEFRLAWREWLAMMTGGRRERRRRAVIGLIAFAVIMTTHILEVAERMADRIGVIASGRLVAEGTLAELRQQNGHNDTSLEDLFIALVNVEAAAA